jgi:hypothetical protein
MTKQHHTTIRSGVKAARPIGPLAKSTASAPKHEQIAQLAYSYWQDRQRREGSPIEDWLRAEAELGNALPEPAA